MTRQLAMEPDHPCFAGHFPDFPVLPGALLLDEVLHVIESERGVDLAAWTITSGKFLGVVRPGDNLDIEHDAPSETLIRFTLRVGDVRVATGTLSRAWGASGT